MFPIAYQARYKTLRKAIQESHATLALEPLDPARVHSSITQLQHLFQTQISGSNSQTLDAKVARHLDSLNVEIDKQVRLLTMDVLFLNVAKQSVTASQRIQQMRDRLTLLTRYCDALLEEE